MPERPAAWADEVNVREVSSIDEIPLAENEPDRDEL